MSDVPRIGLFSVNSYACSRPQTASRIARLAEEVGLESIWAGEHVVLPDPRVPPSPMEPGDPILEPLVALAFLAGQTTRLRLGTGIVILPQRNPLVLAKAVASLDVLSGGRLLLGIGAGYLEPEMTAIGVSIHERGARTDEYLAAMRSLWYDARPHHEGRFARFEGVQAGPRPGRVPIIVGGHSSGAFRRAVEQGDGWYGFGLDLAETDRHLAALREVGTRLERPAELGRLEITITPSATPDRAEARRFAELGVDRLVVQPGRELDEEALVAFVSEVGEALGG
ncbi:MAG: LLM class F420-dependent oxidoreductase [Candidatus Dormibacteraeota bacterium]|nr:LLM class F420-dependent oxidoreductase [Candidatus Dormibacteraeota bacterium]